MACLEKKSQCNFSVVMALDVYRTNHLVSVVICLRLLGDYPADLIRVRTVGLEILVVASRVRKSPLLGIELTF